MNLLALIGLINGILSIGLGFLVFMENRRAIINVTYFIFDATIALFNFGYCFWQLTNNPQDALFWFQILTIGILFINVTFLHVSISILGKVKEKRSLLILLYAVNLLFVFFNFKSMLYTQLVPKYNLGYWPIPTKLFSLYLVFWLWQACYGLYLLYEGFLVSTGHKKEQIRYFMIGCLVGFIGGATNWPLWFNINFPPYLNILIAVHVPLTAYAIVKHKLLDIEVFIKKSLVLTGMFIFAFGVFVASTFLISQLVGGNSLISLTITSLIIVIGLRPIETILINATDKYLFQKEYDRQQLMKEFSQGIVGKIELEKLKSFICSALSEKMKLENISIIDEDNILFSWHKKNKTPVSYDTIDYLAKRKKDDVAGVKTRMKELRTSLSVPIFFKDELFWLLLLGNKKSGRIYSDEDINTLEALSHEVSIAIENAINFQELKRSQLELLRQENLKFVSVLVKGLAHEIFNPLTPLMHKIEDLEGEDLLNIYEIYENNKSKLDKDDELKFKESLLSLRESTRSLKNNASHIHLIVDTLNKLEKGDEKTVGPVDMKSFFKEIVTILGLEIEPNLQQGIVVNQNIERNLPPIKANPTLLKQIFINLYKNSCHAMKDSNNKTIEILGKFNEPKKDEILIEFSDTGAGIPPEILPKIFTHGFTTKGAKGSGVGLNQCKAVIERFGGSISVESEKGKGTKFVIRFPIWKEETKDAC